jgi:hypothetical protein
MTRSPIPPPDPSHPQRPGRRAADVDDGAGFNRAADDSAGYDSAGYDDAARASAHSATIQGGATSDLESRVLPSFDPPTRARRFKRVAASLAGVVLLYCAYDLLAVPLIEPAANLKPAEKASLDDVRYASEAVSRQRQELAAWFAPGDWELTSPIALQSPKGMLLLKSYTTLPDGKVEIKPCTLVFLPQGQFADEAERRRRAIVLQAPLAILEFDTPLDLKHAKFGKLVGGKLLGLITIRSDQREPGPQDDLWMTTQDVELVDDRLSTPHPVEFRLGRNAGWGRKLAIALAPADAEAAQRGLAFGGMRSLELADNVWMRVEPGQVNPFPGPTLAGSDLAPQPRAAGSFAASRSQPQLPLEVQCAGAFRFDMERYEATFERSVIVSRVNVNGPSDQLTCELLSLFFETVALTPAAGAASSTASSGTRSTRAPSVNATKAAADKKAGFPKLELARIVATGSPVIIRSPSRGAQARGQRLEYDVKRQSGSLGGPGTLEGLAPGGNAIGSGSIAASGTASSGPRPIKAAWTDQLVFRPYQGQQVLSIEGNADVQVTGAGRIRAGEIHLWLVEQDDSSRAGGAGNAPGRKGLVPAKLLACGHEKNSARKDAPPQSAPRSEQLARPKPRELVRIESPELTGDVGELRAWFDYAAEASLARPDQLPVALGAVPPGPHVGAPLDPNADVWLGATRPPGASPPAHGSAASIAPAAPPPRQYHMDGDLVQLQVVVRGRTAEVTEVDIEGGVRFVETQTASPGEEPWRIAGSHVHVKQPRPQEIIANVTGQPAHVEARGMTIDAGAINVDRAGNRAWVEGPGAMTFLVDRDMEGQPLARPQRIKLSWKGGMNFDGQRARFDRDVVAQGEEQRLSTETMVATFSRFVRFGEGGQETRPEIERIDCDGGVFLERRARDKAGQLASIERLQTQTLALRQRTGEMTARGPGWLNSVRIDKGEGLPGGRGFGGGAAAVRPRGAADGALRPDGLVYLGVYFQGDLVGNRQTLVMEFHRQVRTVVGPVVNWEGRLDPDDFDSQRDRGVLMESDELNVSQRPAIAGQAPTYVLVATGNTTVDGNYDGANYWASAAKLKYEDAKDLLVLEGDGRGPAQLFRQAVVGGDRPRIDAERILFHPKTNEVKFDNAQFGEASGMIDLPTGPRRPTGSGGR